MVKAAWEEISIIFTHLGLDIELDSISLGSAWLEQSALFLTLLCSQLIRWSVRTPRQVILYATTGMVPVNGISSKGSAGTIDPGKKRDTEEIREVELGYACPKSHPLPGSGWALGQVFWLVTMHTLLEV